MQPRNTVVSDSRISSVATVAGYALTILALIVLAGWTFRAPALMSVLPDFASMTANSALSFLLAGLALIRRNHEDARFYALAVFAIGALTFVEYLSGHNFGIDQLLFRDPYSSVDPGRMSQITSVGFVVLGPALWLVKGRSQNTRRISLILGLIAGALGGIALLGYSYDTRALYSVRPYSSVAIHTAFGFVIAALGVQCANPREGLVPDIFADTAGGAMLRRLLPAGLLVPYLIGFAIWIAHKLFSWEMGFSMALLVASTMLILALIMFSNAKHLEREELALREMNRTLEDRVHKRTEDLAAHVAELERMQVIVDQQRAQMIAASKLTSLGEMAGGLAHEINSPLNIIQARAADLEEIALSTSLVESSDVLKAAASILRTGERIMSVVRGLRTFARDGRSDPFQEVLLHTIIDDTLALCQEKFAAHGVRVEVSGLKPDFAIECQRVQISQVLLNLLNNAFDAMQSLPDRWVRITVSEEGPNVSIAVTDSGRGIPKEIAQKAMQPFFTTKPIGKGTGLGLSISRAIAEAHHGHLRIDSRTANTRIVLSIPKVHISVLGGDP